MVTDLSNMAAGEIAANFWVCNLIVPNVLKHIEPIIKNSYFFKIVVQLPDLHTRKLIHHKTHAQCTNPKQGDHTSKLI